MTVSYREETPKQHDRSWLERPLLDTLVVNWEMILWGSLLVLAVVTRFYLLEPRVMSHDENTHVYYSWRLFQGQGFQHDPLMHGPFQFHLIALSYFIFGDNDLTARIPAVLFSIGTVAFVWAFRRYLGRAGTLIAGVMMLISPYILYYGRYVRNEALVGLFGVVMLWAILRYLETGQDRYTYWLTLVTVLHFTAKETAFIYQAQAMLFLGLYFVLRLASKTWPDTNQRRNFIIAMIGTGLAALVTVASYLLLRPSPGAADVTPVAPGQGLEPLAGNNLMWLPYSLGILTALALLAALFYLVRGYSFAKLRQERSFGLLVLLGTFVLPQLAPLPASLAGINIPTNAGEVNALDMQQITQLAAFTVPLILISIAIGLWWNRRLWLVNAAIFWSVFTVFYTTLFTYGAGFFTGLLGSLGYWLEQQGVQRGSQPWYYYGLIQIPVYEYLPALGSLAAILLALFRRDAPLFAPAIAPETDGSEEQELEGDELEGDELEGDEPEHDEPERAPVVPLLGFWAFTALIAYTIAGEKMPWLTFHITLPMILLAGWSFGWLIETTDWSILKTSPGWVTLALAPVFMLSLSTAMGSLLGPQPPFQGKDLEQLAATSQFLMSAVSALASGVGLVYTIRPWSLSQFLRISASAVLVVLAFLTARTTFKASYVSYDDANELLVYAHSAGGVKQALDQIEEISLRTTNGLGVVVAYDNETSYPYLWYLRNYTNARYFGDSPTRSLRDAPVILVGDANYGKIEAVVGQAYERFDYIRLWWPNQDYFGLTWERIRNAFTDPVMRGALFQIWLNRDYTAYGKALGRDISLPQWSPAARMRLYVRKDIVSQMWNYGAAPSSEPVVADPYEGKGILLSADTVLGSAGSGPAQFQRPHDLALAPDGTLYVVDTDNHRIQHLSTSGDVLQIWGSFADVSTGNAPGGTFNQPWGIAVGPDGSVYVADLWNHRIQKFTADGQFLMMWGYFGQAEQPDAFWGPRDVATDTQGRVYVTDTGNKRVVVFDANGVYLGQFGSAGLGPGEMDEPVGLAISADGLIYVADTWNQRIQAFREISSGNFAQVAEWPVVGWYGQSLDNKPYLAADTLGNVYATDPEGYRVLQFNGLGEFIRYWGDYGIGPENFGLAAAIAVDGNGGAWVSDSGNNRILHFALPIP